MSEELLLDMRALRIEARGADGVAFRIVSDVDVKLHRGEVLGLIGESGAGKSTIGLASMCFARPGCKITGGKIIFDGSDLVTLPEDEVRQMRGVNAAYIAQSAAASFNPSKRLNDQVTEAAVRHNVMGIGDATMRAEELYAKLDLPDPANIGRRYPHQVSGGQLQRVMSAMAMTCGPDLLVLDEPTTALDVTTQIEVLATVRDLIRTNNTAALYITHDLAVVAQIADRIMVLRYGELIEEGTTEQILHDPHEAYTKELISARTEEINTKVFMGMPENPVLSIKNVTASYDGKVDVLKNISVDIGRGETVAVVGESGSGKSTLARVVTGLLPPREGHVEFDGNRFSLALKERSKEELRKAQMIYQMPDVAMNPRQRVSEIIGRPLTFYFGLTGKEREDRMFELLREIDMGPEFADRYPGQLSGGQKQRVCIARALAADPEMIICDEVTSALDQVVAAGILKLLDRLQKEKDLAYMLITHDLGVVRNIADRTVVMYQGNVVEQGTTEQIFTPPQKEAYTQKLIASTPEMRTDWLDGVLRERGDLFEIDAAAHT
ncbi:MAG: ABC transporter ATP-binding protein [Alphaproteobacteria bacterium]|jgi:peptide/nickel transport system ATP-binding protein|nr:ABC transporter ATP-binding protein [Rhodospirillaceae bacterium]MBT6203415.1 ABC transporter ATP-binding protein [Rhodospirillaceae bacterium]MBT6512526.1 ABC transporter ATP-binding protein [Rhodospirillaceae bacterium]MBT7646068.1 ABC transporter ATP-binding protein [Rhodospirillaceae bacterium]MDG2480466.1 ABC transporter ATP-binding protein [Alphaproteobacteria bacterium]